MGSLVYRSSKPLLSQLNLALQNLRRPWPEQWPGLPLVFERAWAQLELASPRRGSRTDALLSFGRAVTARIEQDGAARFATGQEPSYHNRLHIADTLVCMTYLLHASRALKVPGSRNPPTTVLALAIMAGHDFLHPGGSNALPSEFETQAVRDLQPLMQKAQVSAEDREVMAHCILATDPARVKSFHAGVQQSFFDLRQPDCLAVMVLEADILASMLPRTQESLTQALSKEWAPTLPLAAEKLLLPQSRLVFLEHAALFSSPAAKLLGLKRVKDKQIYELKTQLGQSSSYMASLT